MTVLLAFLRYALVAIGWHAEVKNNAVLATDLHGARYRIMVTPCE